MSAGLVLHLCSAGDVSLEEIVRWLGGSRYRNVMNPSSGEDAILYRNPDTAVEANFEFYDKAEVEAAVPLDFRPTGVRFRLWWPRPSFFPLEAVPVLIELAEAKRLTLAMPQHDNRKMSPVPAIADEIIRLWRVGNAVAVSNEPAGTLPYMSPGRSERWWRYQVKKDALHHRLGEDIFVPTLVGVAPNARKDNLLLHITWTDAVPLVIPECDLVSILEGTSPADFRIRGVATYDDVQHALGELIEPLHIEGLGELHLLKPKQAKRARSVFQSLPVREMALPQLEPAAWVDVM